MFKKPLVITSKHQLSGADHKKLKKTIEKHVGTEETINLVLPGKV